jgi:Na+-driven multidrug efflux pump
MGFQPIAGYNYGAHKYDRVKKILLISGASATALAAFFALIMQLFPYTLIGIFTKDLALIESGGMALRIMSSLIVLMGAQTIFSIYFQAVGKGIHSLLLGLSRQFLILVPLVLILPRYWGATGVWASFPISDLLSTIITGVVLWYELRHLNEKHEGTLQPAMARVTTTSRK